MLAPTIKTIPVEILTAIRACVFAPETSTARFLEQYIKVLPIIKGIQSELMEGDVFLFDSTKVSFEALPNEVRDFSEYVERTFRTRQTELMAINAAAASLELPADLDVEIQMVLGLNLPVEPVRIKHVQHSSRAFSQAFLERQGVEFDFASHMQEVGEEKARNIYLAWTKTNHAELQRYLFNQALVLVKQFFSVEREVAANDPEGLLLSRFFTYFFVSQANIGRFLVCFEHLKIADKALLQVLNFLTAALNFKELLGTYKFLKEKRHYAGRGVFVNPNAQLSGTLSKLLTLQAGAGNPYPILAEHFLEQQECAPKTLDPTLSQWLEKIKRLYSLRGALQRQQQQINEHKEEYSNKVLKQREEQVVLLQRELATLVVDAEIQDLVIPEREEDFNLVCAAFNPFRKFFAAKRAALVKVTNYSELEAFKKSLEQYVSSSRESTGNAKEQFLSATRRCQFVSVKEFNVREQHQGDVAKRTALHQMSCNERIATEQYQRLGEEKGRLDQYSTRLQQMDDRLGPRTLAPVKQAFEGLMADNEGLRSAFFPEEHGYHDLQEVIPLVHEHKENISNLGNKIVLLEKVAELLKWIAANKEKLEALTPIAEIVDTILPMDEMLEARRQKLLEENEAIGDEVQSATELSALSALEKKLMSQVRTSVATLNQEVEAYLPKVRVFLQSESAGVTGFLRSLLAKLIQAKRSLQGLAASECAPFEEKLKKISEVYRKVTSKKPVKIDQKLAADDTWCDNALSVDKKIKKYKHALNECELDLNPLLLEIAEFKRQKSISAVRGKIQQSCQELQLLYLRLMRDINPAVPVYQAFLKRLGSIKKIYNKKPITSLYERAKRREAGDRKMLRRELDQVQRALKAIIELSPQLRVTPPGREQILREGHPFLAFDSEVEFSSQADLYQTQMKQGFHLLNEELGGKDADALRDYESRLKEILGQLRAHSFAQKTKADCVVPYVRWVLEVSLPSKFKQLGEPFDPERLLALLREEEVTLIDLNALQSQLTAALEEGYVIDKRVFDGFIDNILKKLALVKKVEDLDKLLVLLGCFAAAPDLIPMSLRQKFSECLFLVAEKYLVFGTEQREEAGQGVSQVSSGWVMNSGSVNLDAQLCFFKALAIHRELLYYYPNKIPSRILQNRATYAMACATRLYPGGLYTAKINFTPLTIHKAGVLPTTSAAVAASSASGGESAESSSGRRKYHLARKAEERSSQRAAIRDLRAQSLEVMPCGLMQARDEFIRSAQACAASLGKFFQRSPVACYRELWEMLVYHAEDSTFCYAAAFYLLLGTTKGQAPDGVLKESCEHQMVAGVIHTAEASSSAAAAAAPARPS